MRTLTKQTIHRIGCWAILLVILATACSPLPPWAFPAGGAEIPGQGSEQGGLPPDETEQGDISQDQGQALLERGQPPVGQDAPPTPPLDIMTVDLDANVSQETERSPLMECTKLDGVLLSVIAASNPLEMAQALHLRVQGDKIQVMLILDGADTAFLGEFEVEIGKQSGDQVQAFVPVARLCDLANDERVLAVYPPNQAIIQQ